MKVKKRQHYVWQYYLRAWTERNQIWCYNNSNIFQTSTRNLAVEKNIYTPQETTIEEISFLSRLFSPHQDNVSYSERASINNRWNEIFSFVIDVEKRVADDNKVPPDVRIKLKNTFEEIQSHIEILGQTSLEKLRLGTGILTIEEKVKFIHFIIYQYMRTKKSKQLISSIKDNFVKFNLEKLWPFIIHFMASQISFGLIQNWDIYKIIVLLNNTEYGLITGDQPVVTTSSPSIKSQDPEDFLLYYPVSPKRAVILTTNLISESSIELSSSDVIMFNGIMYENKLHQVYAKHKEDFNPFLV